MAIASGSLTNKDVGQAAGIDSRSLHYYLKQLVELGYVERRYPLTNKVPANREVRLAIGDPLLRFWFRFLYPYTSELARYTPQENYAHLVKADLPAYFGSCFEQLCREALHDMYRHESVSGPARIGEYWSSKVQIDVVSLRNDGCIDLGECNWGGERSLSRVADELARKIPLYPNPENQTIRGRLFFRKKPGTKAALPPNLKIHQLEELYL